MNKQELIEAIGELPNELGWISIGSRVVSIKDRLLELVNQLDEPQKVVVPKLVAEWYEKHKTALNADIFSAITGIYRKVNGENDDLLNTFEGWLTYEKDSILILSKIHRYGYEIEPEKPETLYTVEIPNPKINKGPIAAIALVKNHSNEVQISVFIGAGDWKEDARSHLTESEIRKDFEWAWQAGFAKEVE